MRGVGQEFRTPLTAAGPSAAELACGSPPEGFDFGLPPGWTSASSSAMAWGSLAACGEAGNYTGGPGDAACVSSYLTDPGLFEARLRTSPFSLAGVTTARLELRLNYQRFAPSDVLDLEISDDGQSWTLLRRFQQDVGAFALADGDLVKIDLSEFAGRSQLVLRWRYYDPDPQAHDWYAQIDDVGLVCDPLPPCGAGVSERNRLADGGFETGSPSAAWEEYSVNFPSPICTAASCGLAAAPEGDAWAFFGGTTVAETASLEQSFTLFPGPATLSFSAWTPAASGNGQDQLRVLVDDAEVAVLSEGDARYTGGYRPIAVDLTALADGGSHQLRLEAATTGEPAISNFFVDEVAINACPDLTVPPELWIADRTVVEGTRIPSWW